MKQLVDVSFVVIAYNEEARIGRCLDSIIAARDAAQGWRVEIIAVDNNSSDRTASIIRSYADRGVRYVFQGLQGVGHARQAGLDVASGEFILSCDADTHYPGHYLEAMIGRLMAHGVSCVYTPYWFLVDGDKGRFSLTVYSVLRDFAVWLRSLKRPELCVGGAAMAFRRRDALLVGWRTDIRRGEDGSMLLGLKKFGRPRIVLATFVPSVRVHSTSRTLDADGSVWGMVRKRISRELRRVSEYFTRKKIYEDQDHNKL